LNGEWGAQVLLSAALTRVPLVAPLPELIGKLMMVLRPESPPLPRYAEVWAEIASAASRPTLTMNQILVRLEGLERDYERAFAMWLVEDRSSHVDAPDLLN
jgi:hypothetical protein